MYCEAGDPDDSDAFEALFRREFGPISRTAYLIVGDWEVAREIAQEAFVQVLKHWDRVQELESPGGWVRRVAIRKAVRARNRDRRGRSLLGTAAVGVVGESAAPDVDVHAAVMRLPRRQRAVIALYYFDDQSVAEIAGILGCSTGTVKTHLARGRQALASRLGEELEDESR